MSPSVTALLLFSSTVAVITANEDVVRDIAIGNYRQMSDVTAIKRAMSQSLGLESLADAFVSKVGTVSKHPTGIYPIYPKPVSKDMDYVTNCLKSFSPFGKREVPAAPVQSGEAELQKLANRDIVFVMDTSGSILGSEFLLAKEAISSLIEAFCPLTLGHEVTDEGTKQISMVLFGSGVTKVIDFQDSVKGLAYMQRKVMEVKHRREGMTSTARALNFLREGILGQGMSRLNDQRVSTDVIVVTDGRCNNDCDDLAEEADAIRAMGHGVNLFAVGVASARECELDIISGRDPKASFELDGMNSFKDLAETIIRKAYAAPNKCV